MAALRKQYSEGTPYFLYAGAIHPRKNVHRLIRAFDQFRAATSAPVKLLLAGRFAWQTGDIRTAWEQATFRDDIKFLGYLDEQELPRLTAAALAMVYVSLSEGFGLPLVEAMACDVPVITSSISCMPEIAGDAAFLVDPYDESAIALGLQRIYENADLRNDLIAKGRMRKLAFDWNTAAEEIYQIIRETAHRQNTQ